MRLELDSLKQEVAAAEQAVSLANKALEEANGKEAALQIKIGEAHAAYETAKAELGSAEERVEEFSSKIRSLKAEKSDLVKEAESLELQAKKIAVTIARIEKERVSAERLVKTMLKKHSWIETEMPAFGVEGGNYDFSSTNQEELSGQLRALKEEQESLVRSTHKDCASDFQHQWTNSLP